MHTPSLGFDVARLTWQEVAKLIHSNIIITIPLGAEAKEHGPHLTLDNDWTIANYLKQQILEKFPCLMYPTINYHYYPAFQEYPGSVTLSLQTAIQLLLDICKSIAQHGAQRFYIINTGISTLKPLTQAKKILNQHGLLFEFTNLEIVLEPLSYLLEQEGGSHADEVETSLMLYIAPSKVQMSKAAKDYHQGQGYLTRHPKTFDIYSATGIYGDATLATKEKGKVIAEAMVKHILKDLNILKNASLPVSETI